MHQIEHTIAMARQFAEEWKEDDGEDDDAQCALDDIATAETLMLASPDLLAALQECVERLASHDDQSVPELLVAHAAIAKAKGDA